MIADSGFHKRKLAFHSHAQRNVFRHTYIALEGHVKVQYNGWSYEGRRVREHGDDDPDEVRKARLLASLDNGCAIGLSRSQKAAFWKLAAHTMR